MSKDICIFERRPMDAINTVEVFSKSPINIPGLVETKEFMRKNIEEPYAIPVFMDKNSALIVLRFKTRKKNQEQLLTLINPSLLSTTGFILNEEKQFGVEGIYLIPRHPKIEVMYVSLPKGDPVKQELIGKAALVFQQAYQALSGVFICDIGLRIDNYLEYQNGTEEERNEIAHAYLACLRDAKEDAMKDDPELKKYVEATEFLADKVETSIMQEEALTNLAAAGKEVINGQENAKSENDSSSN